MIAAQASAKVPPPAPCDTVEIPAAEVSKVIRSMLLALEELQK